MKNLNDLTKEEMIDLIKSYDRYIQEANDEDKYIDKWYPVCISEFLNNEYMLEKEEQ